MADALHTRSPQDESGTKSAVCAPSQPENSHSAGAPSGGLSVLSSETSPRFLQPPTFSFTPATPSPPPPLSHDDIDDSLIEGLLASEVDSISSDSLVKLPALNSGSLEFSQPLEGDHDHPDTEKTANVGDSSNLSFGEKANLSDCLKQSSSISNSSVSFEDTAQNQLDLISNSLEKSSSLVEKLPGKHCQPFDSSSSDTEEAGKLQDILKDHSKLSSSLSEGNPSIDKNASSVGVHHASIDSQEASPNKNMPDTKAGEAEVSPPQTEDSFQAPLSIKERESVESCPSSAPVETSKTEKMSETCDTNKGHLPKTSPSEHPSDDLPSPSTSVDPLRLPDDSPSLISSKINANSIDLPLMCQLQNEVAGAQDTDNLDSSSNMQDIGDVHKSETVKDELSSSVHKQESDCEQMEVDQENDIMRSSECSESAAEQTVNSLTIPEVEIAKEECVSEQTLSEEVERTESVLSEDFKKVGSACTQRSASKVNHVSLSVSEPLQPVTIGGSLQPLEEVQEASIMNDPSFTADLSLIDSSADEADSIGGLVINSVIGAADGVADFHPDDEMETDRQLTDISSSAPRVMQESCEIDSSEDNGPSAKRMRLDNGENEMDDKLEDCKRVVFKVSPVKNGHGLWDSVKLKDVLVSKGTIVIRIHASTTEMENYSSEKCEIEVDFSCVMISAKDEETNQILGLSSQEPDPDVYDPLAIGTNAEHNSPPHFTPQFAPQSRGRSTALQPALPRPVYRQLQSPPHVFNKNEVLGLPQPLEFEEPQMGTPDMTGMGSRTEVLPAYVDLPQPSTVRNPVQWQSSTPLKLLSKENGNQKTNRSQSVILKKVCEHCGKIFNKSNHFLTHLRTHRPVLYCDYCKFFTKDKRKFINHKICHEKANPKEQCNICKGFFATACSQKTHKRKIHGVIECKICCEEFHGEDAYENHLFKAHAGHKLLKGYVRLAEAESTKHVNIFKDPPPFTTRSELVCRLCNKVTRNKYQLKIHIAQHLGVTSHKISDELVAIQDIEKFEYACSSLSFQEICQKLQEKTSEVLTETNSQALGLPLDIPIKDEAVDIHEESSSPTTSTSNSNLDISATIKEDDWLDTSPFCSPSQNTETTGMGSSDVNSQPGTSRSHLMGTKSELLCQLCDKVTQNKYQLKVHIAQHLGVTSDKISDEFMATEDIGNFDHAATSPSFRDICEKLQKKDTGVSSKTDNQGLDFSLYEPTKYDPLDVPEERSSSPGTSMSNNSWLDTLDYSPTQSTDATSVGSIDRNSQQKNSRSHPSTSFPKSPIGSNISIELKRTHSKEKVINTIASYYCDKCPAEFKSGKTLRKHKMKHSRDTVKCPECDVAHLAKNKVIRHFKAAHKDKFRCRYHCMLLFNTKEDVFQHYREFHNIAVIQHYCSYCGLEYMNEGNLLNHLDKCIKCPPENRPAHVCGNCPKVFPDRQSYDNHIESCIVKDVVSVPACGNCHKKFVYRRAYKNHIKRCTVTRNDEVGKKALQKSGNEVKKNALQNVNKELKPTVRKEFGLGDVTVYPQECRYCQKEFKDKKVAVQHCVVSHKNKLGQMLEHSYMCPLCGLFFENSLICKHITQHYQDRKMWNNLVPRNLLTFVNIRNYCWICRCTLRDELEEHDNARNYRIEQALLGDCKEPEEKPFSCIFCQQQFKGRYDYWGHVKGHLAELPESKLDSLTAEVCSSLHSFKCLHCEFRLVDEREMYKHLALHAIEQRTK